MRWKTSRSIVRVALPVRLLWYTMAFTFLAGTAAIGLTFFPWSLPGNEIYWSAWTGVAIGIALSTPLRMLIDHYKIRRSAARVFENCGSDRSALISASALIRGGNEIKALQLLSNMKPALPKTPAETARIWLKALAGARWLSSQTAFEALPGSVERFPQIHALMYCHAVGRSPLRMKSLSEELDTVSSAELDAYARGFISLIDVLVENCANDKSLFAAEAPELLSHLTGRSHLPDGPERFVEWWKSARPLYVRGGGALLAGLRLIQRADFADAARLLERFAKDGLLSRETDTLRRSARFLALFSMPQWHMSTSDIPRYFEEGMYHLWSELGVFRYSTSELPEVVSCCERGKVLRAAKRRLIEDALDTWAAFGDDLAEPMSLLLRKLLDERSRHQSTRLELWRSKWELRRKNFDKDVECLMRGIVCASKQDWNGAISAFTEAAKLDPSNSLPLVNSVYVMFKKGRKEEARQLIQHIQTLHPRDGQALLLLGQLLAFAADEPREAEQLYLKALNLLDPPTDALNCLGEVKHLMGLHDESQHYFELARQLAPDQPRPKLGLARVFVETQRFKEAIEVLKEVARDGPGEARDVAYYMLYRTHREAGEDRASLKYLELLPARFFNDPDTIDDIAVHLESEKMYAKAREFSERAELLRANGKGRNDDPGALGAI